MGPEILILGPPSAAVGTFAGEITVLYAFVIVAGAIGSLMGSTGPGAAAFLADPPTVETVADTADALDGVEDLHTQEVTAPSVAEGLVQAAAANGGILLIGATRTRRLRRWILGGTPDQVIRRAERVGLPVVVFATSRGVHGRFEDYTYPVYRRVRRFFSDSYPSRGDVDDAGSGVRASADSGEG